MGSILYLFAVWWVTRYFFPWDGNGIIIGYYILYNEVSENEFWKTYLVSEV